MGIDRFENVANRYETQRSPRVRKRERKGRGMGACAHGRYNKGKRRVHFRGACASPLLPPPNSPFQSEISRNGRVPSVKVDLDRAKQRQRHAQGLNSDENRSSLLCERFRFFDGQLASEFKGFIVIFPPAFFFSHLFSFAPLNSKLVVLN